MSYGRGTPVWTLHAPASGLTSPPLGEWPAPACITQTEDYRGTSLTRTPSRPGSPPTPPASDAPASGLTRPLGDRYMGTSLIGKRPPPWITVGPPP